MRSIKQGVRSPSTWILGILALLASGCGEDEGTAEFAPVYVAAAYGTVTTAGVPAADVPFELMYIGVPASPSFAPTRRNHSVTPTPSAITQSRSTATIPVRAIV
jgi:hypothetical protein